MIRLRYWLFFLSVHSLHPLTTLQVTVPTDNNAGGFGEVGDLRFWLNTMNTNLQTALDSYEITFATPMIIQLNGILPIINNSSNPVDITIGNADTIPTVTIDGQDKYPGFFTPIGNVTIKNIIFQNCVAKGGNGGDGLSGGGGGMGAGGALYAPKDFFNSTNPSVTLMNVMIHNCGARGGHGGNAIVGTGAEGGGGGGGFGGNGGSIVTAGRTGGGGGGGFGGDGGDVVYAMDHPSGGGGGGGGGFGSRTELVATNLGYGGSDANGGGNGNGYGLQDFAGSGGGTDQNQGGINGGGGGGGAGSPSGGGGGGSNVGTNGDGKSAQGNNPPGGGVDPSGGRGADGGGGGGAGIVDHGVPNNFDGQAGSGGYGGGGGGGAGIGSHDLAYTVRGGSGGIGGGGGGGGVNESGDTSASGGNSGGGGGGGGGGSSLGITASGGIDNGHLGGGDGGVGANFVGGGGGGGGGGSGLGGAIFVDSGSSFTIQALSGIPTVFDTIGTFVQQGHGGLGYGGGSDGFDGSSLGNSIFLRSNSILNFIANNPNDILTLGDQVSFVDDTDFNAGATQVFVKGDGTVIYNGSTDYQGAITIFNTHFKVNGLIDRASINVCRKRELSLQRGRLSGRGVLTGNVLVNSGIISPDTGQTLTLGRLFLHSANPIGNTLGSLVHTEINAAGTSLVFVTGPATLAGILEIDLAPDALPGNYIVLSSAGITGTFDSISFTGKTPEYSLSYRPVENPTEVEFNFLGYPNPVEQPSHLQGVQKKNNFGLEYELYNQLTWSLSLTADITAYVIYRDGKKIATLSGLTHSYQDHDRKKGVSYTYTVFAVNAEGDESAALSITVAPLKA